MQKMKILITGATGFIGQHLIEELKGDDFFIRIIKRNSSSELRSTNTNFETYISDISDKSALEQAFQNIDVVINLAVEKNDSTTIESTNLKGVQNIIELSEKYNIKKIIHLSSISIFGMKYSRKKFIVGDDFPCDPKTKYGISKLRSEILLKEFANKNTTEVIILRSGIVFGEYQSSNYLLDFLKRVKSGVAIPRLKNSMVNYVYVKDVTHVIRFFLENTTGNKVITVSESIPFSEFLSLTANTLNVSCKINNVPSLLFVFLEIFNYFGLEKLKEKFHSISNCIEYDDAFMKNVVTYKYGISRGVKKTIEYYNL